MSDITPKRLGKTIYNKGEPSVPVTTFDLKFSLRYSLSDSRINYMKFANLCYNRKEQPSKLLRQFYLDLLGVKDENELAKYPEFKNYFEEGKKLIASIAEKKLGIARFDMSKYMKQKMQEFREQYEN